jgi:adenine-specific DNA-methyltransferase
LKELDIRINFGIKTGYNEAFIIDEAKKDELVGLDPKNAEIIKPILRGRDLKKYSFEFNKQWAICTFPSLAIPIEDYPEIGNYFRQIGKKRLEQSGENGSRKKTTNKWFETQDSISYWRDFEKPKIVWGEISDKPKFAYDDEGYYAEATTFLMTGEKLKFLMAILNSKVSEWYFKLIGTTTGMGTNRWKKYKIELLPIRIPTESQEQEIEHLVDTILKIKKGNPSSNTADLENQIDQLVYELYGLTEEEIRIVEGGDL